MNSNLRSWMVAGLLAALGLLGPLSELRATHGAEPAPRPQTDDQLLKDLDEQLGDKQPAGPRGALRPDGQQPDNAPVTTKAVKEKPTSTRPIRPSESASPALKAKTGAQESTDERLLRDLDASDEKGAPPQTQKPGSDLGSDADPLTRIGTKMRQAETLIDRDKLSGKTTRLQGDIVHDIDELMKQIRKQMQKSSSDSSQSSQQAKSRSQGPAKRTAVQQPGRPKSGGQQPSGRQPVAGPQDSKKPARDSQEGVRRASAARADMAALSDVITKVWRVDLPDKDREQMQQAASEQFLPKYEDQIIKYFRRLAEESEPSP